MNEPAMDAAEYRGAISRLGLTQKQAGHWLGLSLRTAQKYAADGAPMPVAKLLRLMLRLNLKPEDVQ